MEERLVRAFLSLTSDFFFYGGTFSKGLFIIDIRFFFYGGTFSKGLFIIVICKSFQTLAQIDRDKLNSFELRKSMEKIGRMLSAARKI